MNLSDFENMIIDHPGMSEKNLLAARLHLVDGLNIKDAADKAGILRSSASRSIQTLAKKIAGVDKKAKKESLFLSVQTRDFLRIVGSDQSSALNLCVNFCELISSKVALKPGELLLCCDVLNPGANLCEFDVASSIDVARSLDSIRFSLLESKHHEPGIFEKWGVAESDFMQALENLSMPELFAVAVASREFWTGGIKGFDSYQEWAAQYCKKE